MSLGITWYTIEEAAAKYGLKTSLILKWVEEGLIRSEQDDTRAMRINSDDLELKVQEKTGI
ncbi:MAG: MerR family transcriptional regulator [Geobacteraceae bacterium]|nr:MerR family transcriptional regulator [Geobacteraceae bacterium]